MAQIGINITSASIKHIKIIKWVFFILLLVLVVSVFGRYVNEKEIGVKEMEQNLLDYVKRWTRHEMKSKIEDTKRDEDRFW